MTWPTRTRSRICVLTRAGASTLGELAALGKPSILVPYPYAAQAHQAANAARFEAAGAAVVLTDGELAGRRSARASRTNGAAGAPAGARPRCGATGRRRPGSRDSRTDRSLSSAKEASSVKAYHFVGIGGIGMSAIARILLARGERVFGSDIALSPLVEELRAEGARVTIGHHARNVRDADAVIVSSAIDRRNPEYAAAVQLGIPVLRRGEMLSRLLRDRRGIAVCGTHGKTTTTAMTHAVLRRGGIDASLVLGGIDVELGSNAYDGASPWFVTEADESDGSFALLEPAMAIVTNIENDHLTSDDELPGSARAFAEFLAKAAGRRSGGDRRR